MPGERTRGCKLPEECRGMAGERTVVGAKCQGIAGECRGMQGNARETYGNVNCQGNAGNAGKCQGNVSQWVYSARGMQGTTRRMQGSGCKVLAE